MKFKEKSLRNWIKDKKSHFLGKYGAPALFFLGSIVLVVVLSVFSPKAKIAIGAIFSGPMDPALFLLGITILMGMSAVFLWLEEHFEKDTIAFWVLLLLGILITWEFLSL